MQLAAILDRFPRVSVAHVPTPVEPLVRLGAELGHDILVKRDDCTGFGFGGNKVRQLEFYFGQALAERADTVLITGAVQSNYARTAAAFAAHFGMECHIQMEERVPRVKALYRENGNVLLSKLMGAHLHGFPEGEDEARADKALADLADTLRAKGKMPFQIPLGAEHPPLGSLGYVAAAIELSRQLPDLPKIDEIILPSGSSLTHVGLLFGLRALGIDTPVRGICVRRNAGLQQTRVTRRALDLAAMLDVPPLITHDDILLSDQVLGDGYGRLSPTVSEAISLTARTEGLFLDPVYSGKAMAGMIGLAKDARRQGKRVLFWHTGGSPALFAYGDLLN